MLELPTAKCISQGFHFKDFCGTFIKALQEISKNYNILPSGYNEMFSDSIVELSWNILHQMSVKKDLDRAGRSRSVIQWRLEKVMGKGLLNLERYCTTSAYVGSVWPPSVCITYANCDVEASWNTSVWRVIHEANHSHKGDQ